MALTAGPIHNFGGSTSNLSKWLRRAGGLQPGASTATGLKVAQNVVPNTSVSIASGFALVAHPAAGLYVAQSDAAVTALTGGGVGHATLPRIDRVILKVFDKIELGSTIDGCQLLIRQGTATAGATLDNPVGAAALGSGELLLADLLMPAVGTTYVTANIRDRRTYATGAKTAIAGNQAGNITTTSTTDVGAASHTAPRIEIAAGNAVKATGVTNLSATGGTTLARVRMSGPSTLYTLYSGQVGTNNTTVPIVGFPFNNNTAGNYSCTLLWNNNLGGTATMQNNSTFSSVIFLEEIVGGFQDNS